MRTYSSKWSTSKRCKITGSSGPIPPFCRAMPTIVGMKPRSPLPCTVGARRTTDVRTPTVNLLISSGQEPPAYLCPRFIGQPIAEVRRILEKNGFKVGQVTPVATEGAPPGIILTQSPPSGSKIGSDSIFTFQVTQ